jgi:hypothetical protein
VKRVLRVSDDGKIVEAEVEQNGVFHVQTAAGKLSATVVGVPAPIVVEGPWRLTVNGTERNLDMLVSWTHLPDLREFSGTVTYRTRFSLPASYFSSDIRLELDLGEVRDIAEVVVNGKSCGVAWKQPYRVETTGAARPGENDLEIRVTNSLMNRTRVKQPTEADRPPAMSPELMRDYVPEPVPSGLIGTVRVQVSRRVTLR